MTQVLGKPIFLPSLSSKSVPNKCLYVPQVNLGSYLLLWPQTQFQIIAALKCHLTELPYDLLLHAAGFSFIKDDTVSSIRSSKAQLRQAYYRMLVG